MKIKIDSEYIKLDQLLKFANIASSGGESKIIIQEGLVFVNGEVELRRGRKLYTGDIVQVGDEEIEID